MISALEVHQQHRLHAADGLHRSSVVGTRTGRKIKTTTWTVAKDAHLAGVPAKRTERIAPQLECRRTPRSQRTMRKVPHSKPSPTVATEGPLSAWKGTAKYQTPAALAAKSLGWSEESAMGLVAPIKVDVTETQAEKDHIDASLTLMCSARSTRSGWSAKAHRTE